MPQFTTGFVGTSSDRQLPNCTSNKWRLASSRYRTMRERRQSNFASSTRPTVVPRRFVSPCLRIVMCPILDQRLLSIFQSDLQLLSFSTPINCVLLKQPANASRYWRQRRPVLSSAYSPYCFGAVRSESNHVDKDMLEPTISRDALPPPHPGAVPHGVVPTPEAFQYIESRLRMPGRHRLRSPKAD